jgi:replicative DNA helicase
MIREKTQSLVQAPIYIDDNPNLTIFELRAKCRRLKQKYDIQMIYIDYLQLMHGGDSVKGGNREQEISYISRQLKALSKELGIPVLALSQLSRAVETRGGTKKPVLSDLRESGAIEQDADIVMFIYRPNYYGEDVDEKAADIIVAKHRAGEVGEVRLNFISQFVKFENRMSEGIAPATHQFIDSKINSETDNFYDSNTMQEDNGEAF